MILLDKLDHMQNPDPHWAFTSVAAMIAAALLTFAVGIVFGRYAANPKTQKPQFRQLRT
jgi:hypothetical protein